MSIRSSVSSLILCQTTRPSGYVFCRQSPGDIPGGRVSEPRVEYVSSSISFVDGRRRGCVTSLTTRRRRSGDGPSKKVGDAKRTLGIEYCRRTILVREQERECDRVRGRERRRLQYYQCQVSGQMVQKVYVPGVVVLSIRSVIVITIVSRA